MLRGSELWFSTIISPYSAFPGAMENLIFDLFIFGRSTALASFIKPRENKENKRIALIIFLIALLLSKVFMPKEPFK
jgi:hypothetical protein